MARPANTDILTRLRNDIQAGRYDRMMFLPAERVLAEDYGVGRGVVRTALKTLREEGILRMIPQRGCCIVRGDENAAATPKRVLVNLPHRISRDSKEIMDVLAGICQAASEQFAEVLMSFTAPSAEELIERVRTGDLLGVIYIEKGTYAAELYAAGVPCIIANQELQFDSVNSRADFRTIGRMAGLRLLQAGHRKIGILSGQMDDMIYHEMLAGFRGALAEEEIPINKAWLIPIFSREPGHADSGYDALKKLLSSPDRPTAFFAMRDYRAEQLYRVAAELQLSIPGDISVIGYDNISWQGAEAHHLTTIRQPALEIGRSAVELLSQWCAENKPPQSRIIPGEILERGSIASPELDV